jgi:hypothetical protein
VIVLVTDFGLSGPYTGQLKAVLARAAPAVPVIDLFADAPAFDPRLAAYLLAAFDDGFEAGDVLLCVVDAFQIALALGAPLGKMAWGGRHTGVLPPRLRVASAVAALLLYPLIILVVFDASYSDGDSVPGNGAGPLWALTGLFALGALANLASRSTAERIWAPVSLAISICCGVVASGV